MARIIVSLLEACLAVAAIVLAILWIRTPTGPYEPFVALCGGAAVLLELIRRYLRSLKLRIFVSVGATYTEAQESFVEKFLYVLSQNNLQKLLVGRDQNPVRQPLLEIKDAMRSADAVVVLAFTRYIIESGIQKPHANRANHFQTTIKNEKHPTVWNQIETGIAYGLGKPLLVILEDGLKQEAMLKDGRLEFITQVTPLVRDYFEGSEFKHVFAEFTKIARKRSWSRL